MLPSLSCLRVQCVAEDLWSDISGVVRLPVVRILPVRPLVLKPSRRSDVVSLAMMGQRQYGLGESRIVVSILDPPVTNNDKITEPSRRWRGHFIELQPQLIS